MMAPHFLKRELLPFHPFALLTCCLPNLRQTMCIQGTAGMDFGNAGRTPRCVRYRTYCADFCEIVQPPEGVWEAGRYLYAEGNRVDALMMQWFRHP